MNTFTVAILQILPADSRDGNLQKGIEFCRKAKNAGADLALFPEMFSCGYDACGDTPEDWVKKAIEPDDGFV
ncbi:MAG: carbon-nitrogen hydrolase family protein, partial [Oscillospiraceae bacterium]|nr:carbon-nitrogen hydrolase family protein [Oscillospiraceae bacterium]